jgi:hypothetical protein
MRLTTAALALLLVLPGTAVAQTGPSPIPDHWLTLDSLTELLALTAEQRNRVDQPFAGLNALLQRAVQRREELIVAFRGPPVMQMTPEERQALLARLEAVRIEYEGLQREADAWYAAMRASLSASQQARFDALPKARLVPEAPGPSPESRAQPAPEHSPRARHSLTPAPSGGI